MGVRQTGLENVGDAVGTSHLSFCFVVEDATVERRCATMCDERPIESGG